MNNNIKVEVINGIRYHLYKSNRYKDTEIDITFNKEFTKEEIEINNFLCCILKDTCKKYSSKKEICIREEELYAPFFYPTSGTKDFSIIFKFINPEYIEEKDYLKELFDYLYERIINYNFSDNKIFTKIKEDRELDAKRTVEFEESLIYENAIELFDKDSILSRPYKKSLEYIKNITPSTLEKAYKNILNNAQIEIFIMGNTDIDLIKKEFIKRFNNAFKSVNQELPVYYDHKSVETIKYKEDTSKFNQAMIEIIYNVEDLTLREKHLVSKVFNYIFGSGGLTSKLYKYVREENSLCYSIYSDYVKYHNIIIIDSKLDNKNIDKALKLIDLALKEMQEGKFTEEDINDAKKAFLVALEPQFDDPKSVFSQYKSTLFLNNLTLEEYKEGFPTVTKEEIINVANKIKQNTVYVMKGDNNANN